MSAGIFYKLTIKHKVFALAILEVYWPFSYLQGQSIPLTPSVNSSNRSQKKTSLSPTQSQK